MASDWAADSTWVEAEPVSIAPRWTSVMFAETSWVPSEACCTLREISCVAAPCSSTAAAIADDTSDRRSMVPPISWMALTDSPVADWMLETCVTDLLGRLRGLLGQRLDLGGDHGEAAAGFTRACRLDRGVERQKVGLGSRWC